MQKFSSDGMFGSLAASMRRFGGVQQDVQHEAICRRCGECCREKVIINGRAILTDIYCPALDVETKVCRIYPQRLILLEKLTGRRCVLIATAFTKQEAPSHCSYSLPAYSGLVFDRALLEQIPPNYYAELVKTVAEDRKKIDAWLQKYRRR